MKDPAGARSPLRLECRDIGNPLLLRPLARSAKGGFMSDDKEFKPYVPADTDMPEFTVRALVLGLVMCVVLGAANAYLGLRAGMTIAATYPAAVIGMAVLRACQGLAARGELRPHRRLDRRVGRGRRDLHDPGVRHPRHVEVQELEPDRVPDRHRADDRRRHPRHHVRDDPAAGDGGGPLAALPRVGGGSRDPQGRPARRRRGDAAVRGHGRGRPDQAARRRRRLPRLERRSRSRWARSRRASCGSA